MDKKVTLCPFCDTEQTTELERDIVVCERCGRGFSNDTGDHSHPHEFWSNPDSCARF